MRLALQRLAPCHVLRTGTSPARGSEGGGSDAPPRTIAPGDDGPRGISAASAAPVSNLDPFAEAFLADPFAARDGGRMPSTNHAGVYSASLAYLNAVAAAGSDDARAAIPAMKRAPFRDPLFGEMSIRADGRAVHAMHLFRVKRPEESRGPLDYYVLEQTVPGEQAFRPMAEGGCALVR